MAEPALDPQHFQVREEVFPRDRHQVFSLVNSSGYFLPREMAYGMDMFDEHLMKGDISNYHFMLYADDTMLVACGCYGPIRLSDRRYLIHWMAVDRNYQHQGMGRRLEEAICKKIRLLGGVKVYAQTSNRDYHTAARAFYESCGYKSSSTIPDYYGDNDDMVFYAKDLVYR
jgi:ribosomal protein S18 acetylase RimI-like enzyme